MKKNNYKRNEDLFFRNNNKKEDKNIQRIRQFKNKNNNIYHTGYTPEIKRKQNPFIKKCFLDNSNEINKAKKKVGNYNTDKNKKNKKRIKIEKIIKPYKYIPSKNNFKAINKDSKDKIKNEIISQDKYIIIKKENKKNFKPNRTYYQKIKNNFIPKIENNKNIRNPYLYRTYQRIKKKEKNKILLKYSTIMSYLLIKNNKAFE